MRQLCSSVAGRSLKVARFNWFTMDVVDGDLQGGKWYVVVYNGLP